MRSPAAANTAQGLTRRPSEALHQSLHQSLGYLPWQVCADAARRACRGRGRTRTQHVGLEEEEEAALGQVGVGGVGVGDAYGVGVGGGVGALGVERP